MAKTGGAAEASQPKKPGAGHHSRSLCSLLNYFVGVTLLVELKTGRTYEGALSSASAYMDLELSEATEFVPSRRHREEKDNQEQNPNSTTLLTQVHIRNKSIRYIHFPDNLDLTAVIRVGMDRERAAAQKYSRGKRKKTMQMSHSMDMTTSGESKERIPLTVCAKCKGEGKLIQPASRKARKRHKLSNNSQNPLPPRIDGCKVCQGSGLVEKQESAEPKRATYFPHVAIVGGGLGGLALAVACRNRSIPFTVYERDLDLFQRSQGYGLTMQQASRILESLGIPTPLPEGIVSTKHMVHSPEGRVVGEWGIRKWLSPEEQERKTKANNDSANKNKRQNVHIARQSLRFELLKALGGSQEVQWGHKLVDFAEQENGVDLTFDVSSQSTTAQYGEESHCTVKKKATATLLVGADGIRSSVRRQWLGEGTTPLRYLGCIVILGICPLSPTELTSLESPLLDGETVFQTADGSTRIYMMPYSKNPSQCMWQLSFPMTEQEAKDLSCDGPQALKDESLKRCHSWHDPIVPILQQTPLTLVSGYPVYDRDLLTQEILRSASSSSPSRRVSLVGDAGHPMSPFKGQGANQALLDALSLARTLYKKFRGSNDDSDEAANLENALEIYEEEMLARSSLKVKASAEAAHFLHTKIALKEGNVTRGAAALDQNSPKNNEE